MQDLRKSQAWSINSGKMESNPGDFPGFRRLRAAANSSGLKGSEILWPSGVGIFHRSDSSLLTSLVDSRSLVLCARFSFHDVRSNRSSLDYHGQLCWSHSDLWTTTWCCCGHTVQSLVESIVRVKLIRMQDVKGEATIVSCQRKRATTLHAMFVCAEIVYICGITSLCFCCNVPVDLLLTWTSKACPRTVVFWILKQVTMVCHWQKEIVKFVW